MASLSHAVFGAGAALLFWTCIGLCLTRRLMPPLALPMAPVIGWAAYNAIALLIFLVAPFSHATVLALAGSALAIAFATLRGRAKPAPSAVPAWAYALAALLAIVPAAAILPKFGTDAVYLASPIFDHVKVAMIDDMARLGFPPGNPFFADPEHPRLAYYYLWHFAAAQLALATGISGWEADAAMTWFSAAASLFLMMGLAARIGGATAAVLAVVVSATASARPVLAAILTQNRVDAVDGGIAGWLYQASWVPQHMMAATCVLAAVTLMGELAVRRSVLLVAALALVVAAGFRKFDLDRWNYLRGRCPGHGARPSRLRRARPASAFSRRTDRGGCAGDRRCGSAVARPSGRNIRQGGAGCAAILSRDG